MQLLNGYFTEPSDDGEAYRRTDTYAWELYSAWHLLRHNGVPFRLHWDKFQPIPEALGTAPAKALLTRN